jgi:riboflavin kinase/FMN adenylyltransferase
MTDLTMGMPESIRGTAVTVGTFDGVHRGHRDVLDRLVATAAARGLASLVVTFDPHPLAIVNPAAAPRLLTTAREKLEVIATTGVEYLATLPFTSALSAYSAEQFVVEVLRERFRMGALLVGHDHGFGRARMGDASVLRALGAQLGFDVQVLDPVAARSGQPISSTAIRRAVAGGDLSRAAEQLGRAYSVMGTVVAGAQRGRALGIRTINVAWPDPAKLLPPDGVYVARVETPLGAAGGMLNLGGRPTFGETDRVLEIHLFDMDRDLYGACVRCDFLHRLRDTRRFASPEALRAQLVDDERAAREWLARPAGTVG